MECVNEGLTVDYLQQWGRRVRLAILLLVCTQAHGAEPQAAPSFTVIESQQVDYGDHSVYYNRVETPSLKPKTISQQTTPAVKAVTLSTAEQEAIRKAESIRYVTVMIDAMVYTDKTTILRWWEDGKEYVYRSNVDFNYLRSLCFFDTAKTSYFLLICVSDAGTLPVEYSLKAPLPPITARPQFTPLVADKQSKREVTEFLLDLHAYYTAHKEQLIVAYQAEEKARIAKEEWDKAHPPKPKDITIQYFPIRSNFDAMKGAAK